MKHHILPLLAAGALAVTGIAIAQNAAAPAAPAGKVLGKASQVQGLVTVSQGATVGSVTDNAALYAGSRIVTGSTGKVDLDFIDGCQVKLAPNQSVTLPDDKPCDGKMAVLWLDGGAVVASAAGAGSVSPLVGLAAVAGAAIVGNAINSGGGTGGGATGGGGTTPGGGGTTPGGGGTTPGGGGGIPNPPLSGQ